jgi:cysteine sulfinate desulfinase/cysteine desulfurase-like protein
MGVPKDRAQATLRFGLGRFNTAGEVDNVAAEVIDGVKRLRVLGPS